MFTPPACLLEATPKDYFGYLIRFVLFLVFVGSPLAYWYARSRTTKWPVIEATIHKGAYGGFNHRMGQVLRAFLGYDFVLNGQRYVGTFGLLGSDETCRKLYESLPNQKIQIRYNPADPSATYLVDVKDSRFLDAVATQEPFFLANVPMFDLADAMK